MCVEPFTNPLDALQYAISYEKGMKRQKSMGTSVVEQPKAVKSESVFAVDKHNRKECYRCGADNFNLEHLKKCLAKNHQCEFCSKMGHWEKCCNQKHPQRKRDMQQRMKLKRKELRRINYVSEDEDELEDDELVLQVDGEGTNPFVIEGLLSGNTNCRELWGKD